jgi:hypothetical protein
MNWVITIYVALLFFVLTPGVLVTLPPKSSKLVVAAFHALVFALVWHFTHKLVWNASVSIGAPIKKEGFQEGIAQACDRIKPGKGKPCQFEQNSCSSDERNGLKCDAKAAGMTGKWV